MISRLCSLAHLQIQIRIIILHFVFIDKLHAVSYTETIDSTIIKILIKTHLDSL